MEGVEDRIGLQDIDPHSHGHNCFFPVLLGCSTGGLGVQPLCDMFLLPASSLQLQLLNQRPEGPLCWVLVLSTTSLLQLTDFLSLPGLYNCSTPTFFLWASQISLIQPVHGQGYILIFLDWMHLLFTKVHFLFWQLGWVGGQYATQEATELYKLNCHFCICSALL